MAGITTCRKVLSLFVLFLGGACAESPQPTPREPTEQQGPAEVTEQPGPAVLAQEPGPSKFSVPPQISPEEKYAAGRTYAMTRVRGDLEHSVSAALPVVAKDGGLDPYGFSLVTRSFDVPAARLVPCSQDPGDCAFVGDTASLKLDCRTLEPSEDPGQPYVPGMILGALESVDCNGDGQRGLDFFAVVGPSGEAQSRCVTLRVAPADPPPSLPAGFNRRVHPDCGIVGKYNIVEYRVSGTHERSLERRDLTLDKNWTHILAVQDFQLRYRLGVSDDYVDSPPVAPDPENPDTWTTYVSVEITTVGTKGSDTYSQTVALERPYRMALIATMTQAKDPERRRWAGRLVGSQSANFDTIVALGVATRHADPSVRESALSSLLRMKQKPPDVIALMEDIWARGGGSEPRQVAEALAELGPRSENFLLAGLADPARREAAAFALGRTGTRSRPTLMALVELTGNDDRSVNLAATVSLTRLADGYVETDATEMIEVLVEVEAEMRRRQPNYVLGANQVRSAIQSLKGQLPEKSHGPRNP